MKIIIGGVIGGAGDNRQKEAAGAADAGLVQIEWSYDGRESLSAGTRPRCGKTNKAHIMQFIAVFIHCFGELNGSRARSLVR